jgi:riboflavin kinase/FMN adenylyltransferase
VLRWDSLGQVPPGFGPSAVTIGNFDGVHRGHQAILDQLVRRARALDLTSVAVTFHPHPAAVHDPAGSGPPITGLESRLELMAAHGLDAALVVPYNSDFAQTTPEEFARAYLVGALGARLVVVGRDVRFGRANSGDLRTMAALGSLLGFAVEALDDLGERDPSRQPGSRRRWSSTDVRRALAEGDVDGAARALGRPHRVAGTVERGDGRGRGLGFPTANLGPDPDCLVPGDGVYAGWMTRLALPEGDSDRVLPAAVSIGSNPTFGGGARRIEAHVPRREGLDLYGEGIAVDFIARLRPTLAFPGPAELAAQMSRDVAAAEALLARQPPP